MNKISFFILNTYGSSYQVWARGQFTTQARKDLEIPDCWGLNIKFRL